MMNQTLASPRYSSPLLDPKGRELPSHGKRVCRWIEANCVYGEGDWFGQPVRLRPWQKRFIWRLYEYDPDTGHRRYRRALFGVAKSNGKTPLASWIGAYELLGAGNVAPHVIIGAASYDQADLVFGDLRTCVKQSPTLKPFVEPFEREIQLKSPMYGLAERIAAVASTNDGARATAFIADELHEWLGRVERVFMVVDGAVSKREGAFSLAISTAGVLGDSLLMRLYDHGKKVAAGTVEDDSFLFEWYEAPENLDLDDPEQFEEACRAANPAYGDFLDPASLKHRFQTMPRFEFERYHLNRWTSALNRWLPIEDWDACDGAPDIPEGSTVFVGIDGAAKRDTTAIYVVRPDEDALHTEGAVFEPPEGEVIDPELVENHIRDLARSYDVVQFLYDPALFHRSAQALLEEGLPMVEVPQTVPRKLSFARALYDAVIERRLRHGGDPVLRAHADAVVAKDRGNGWTMEKLKATSPIDACIALAMAVEAATENDYEPGGIAVIDLA